LAGFDSVIVAMRHLINSHFYWFKAKRQEKERKDAERHKKEVAKEEKKKQRSSSSSSSAGSGSERSRRSSSSSRSSSDGKVLFFLGLNSYLLYAPISVWPNLLLVYLAQPTESRFFFKKKMILTNIVWFDLYMKDDF
jgi:hypothetical protein